MKRLLGYALIVPAALAGWLVRRLADKAWGEPDPISYESITQAYPPQAAHIRIPRPEGPIATNAEIDLRLEAAQTAAVYGLEVREDATLEPGEIRFVGAPIRPDPDKLRSVSQG